MRVTHFEKLERSNANTGIDTVPTGRRTLTIQSDRGDHGQTILRIFESDGREVWSADLFEHGVAHIFDLAVFRSWWSHTIKVWVLSFGGGEEFGSPGRARILVDTEYPIEPVEPDEA